MQPRVVFSEALLGLRQRPGRSLLTTLGIVFGVAAVIAMMAIGEGGRRQTLALAESMGLSRVIIRPILVEGTPAEIEDAQRLSQGLRVQDGVALARISDRISSYGARREVRVMELVPRVEREPPGVYGIDSNYLDASGLVRVHGRLFSEEDHHQAGAVALIGRGAARQLFGDDRAAVGADLRVNGVWFKVVGVLAQDLAGSRKLEGFEMSDMNREILVPLNAARTRFDVAEGSHEISELVIDLASEADVAGMTGVLDRALLRLHGGVRDFRIEVPLVLLQQSQETQRVFNLVMVLIASISLLVGGIGIMNVMLSSVLERTREIGVRRAVGATRRDIVEQFLAEATLVSMIGGVVGVVVGFAGAFAVARATGWTTAVSFPSVLVAVGISGTVGIVFGWWPAQRAAALAPTEALRHD